MPSLLNTTVAANYGLMSTQDTYGTGQAFINFGTRNLRLIKVVLSGGSLNDLRYQDGTTSVATGYTQANSLFGQTVRALQTMAEVYYVGQPDGTSFLALVAGDTVDDAAASSNTAGTTYGAMAAVIKATIDNRSAAQHGAGAAGTATTVTITATGTAANPNMFVGAALGTFA